CIYPTRVWYRFGNCQCREVVIGIGNGYFPEYIAISLPLLAELYQIFTLRIIHLAHSNGILASVCQEAKKVGKSFNPLSFGGLQRDMMKFMGSLENQEAGKTTITSRLRKILLIPLSEGRRNSRKRSVSSDQSQNAQKVQAARTVSLSRVVNNTIISLIGQAITWTSTLLLTIA